MEDEIKRVQPWAAYWCVDCPYCEECIESIDEVDFGGEYKCDSCGKEFYIEQY
jgi:predicted SprT family Zn-dependent metalloprotease